MESLVISTPARLHFGLIDMNGKIGRIDGGVGLALDSPHTLIEAKKANDIRVECKDEPEMIDRIVEALEAVRERYGLGGVDLNVKERPLPHVGLGSATQALVGAAAGSPVALASARCSFSLFPIWGASSRPPVGRAQLSVLPVLRF